MKGRCVDYVSSFYRAFLKLQVLPCIIFIHRGISCPSRHGYCPKENAFFTQLRYIGAARALHELCVYGVEEKSQ